MAGPTAQLLNAAAFESHQISGFLSSFLSNGEQLKLAEIELS